MSGWAKTVWDGTIKNNQGLCAGCDDELPIKPIQFVGVFYCDKCGEIYQEIMRKWFPDGINFNLHDIY